MDWSLGCNLLTEATVPKIQNDIIGNLDMGMCTVLTSLNLSAASDTIDHAIFLRRLNYVYYWFLICILVYV